jgi:hypothetical protein
VAGAAIVAVGLSPYLGRWDVPLFDDWLAIIPYGREAVIRWSTALIGLIVALLWYRKEYLTSTRLGQLFRTGAIGIGISTLTLLIVQFWCVVPIPGRDASEEDVRILVGFTKPEACSGSRTRKECLSSLTLDPDEIRAHWGEDEITFVEWLYSLSYLSLAGCVAVLGATFALRERSRRQLSAGAPAAGGWNGLLARPSVAALPKPVFVSYRRADAAGTSGRLYDALKQRYGPDGVFLDVEKIRPGKDFVAAIEAAIAAAGVLVVVIGPDWLRRDGQLSPDYALAEVSMALRSGIAVLPVLVEGARMPGADDLPAEIRCLATCNALKMEHERWADDLRRLTDCIEELMVVDAGTAG